MVKEKGESSFILYPEMLLLRGPVNKL